MLYRKFYKNAASSTTTAIHYIYQASSGVLFCSVGPASCQRCGTAGEDTEIWTKSLNKSKRLIGLLTTPVSFPESAFTPYL